MYGLTSGYVLLPDGLIIRWSYYQVVLLSGGLIIRTWL